MFEDYWNTAKMAHHNMIFISTIALKCYGLQNSEGVCVFDCYNFSRVRTISTNYKRFPLIILSANNYTFYRINVIFLLNLSLMCDIISSCLYRLSIYIYVSIWVRHIYANVCLSRSSSSSGHADSTKFPDFLSPSIYPYHPWLLVGPLDCIQCLHRAHVCKSLLVA